METSLPARDAALATREGRGRDARLPPARIRPMGRSDISTLAAVAAFILVAFARAEDAPSTEVPKAVTAESLGKFKVTYYWVTCEDDAKGERDTEITDPNGKSLGKFRA